MLEGLLIAVFCACGVTLVVHEEWLERGNPRFVPGWTMATVVVLSALGLTVLRSTGL